jgi:hypothetical protein
MDDVQERGLRVREDGDWQACKLHPHIVTMTVDLDGTTGIDAPPEKATLLRAQPSVWLYLTGEVREPWQVRKDFIRDWLWQASP